MKAIIMAGGEGTRLRPLTCDCPKPMMRLMDRPIMDYSLELLARHGVNQAAVTLGYLPERIRDWFGDERHGVRLRYYTESHPLGTAGGVKQAADFLTETFCVLSGDGVTDCDLSAALKFHREKGALATMVLKRMPDPTAYGLVITEPDGRVSRFLEKPAWGEVISDAVNTGIYILEPGILSLIPDGAYDFGKQLFPRLAAEGGLYGWTTDSYWCDVGDIAAYLRMCRDALDGRIALDSLKSDGVVVCPGAQVSAEAELHAPCYIGPGARVERGAVVGAHSIVGAGARIGEFASLKRSVVWQGAQLMEGVQLRGCAVGRDTTLNPCARVYENCALGTGATIGADAEVAPGVCVWPGKAVPDATLLDSNLVWGGGSASCFRDGRLPVQSPSDALRCAQACAAALLPREILLGRTPSAIASAVWHSCAAGLMAQGVRVLDAGVCTEPQLRYAMELIGADCALLALGDGVVPLEKGGVRISHGSQRSICALMSRQDYPRPFTTDAQPVIYSGRSEQAYIAMLASAFCADPALSPPVAVHSENQQLLALAEQAFLRAGLRARFEWEDELMELFPGEIGVWLAPDGAGARFSHAAGMLTEPQNELLQAWTALERGESVLITGERATRAIAEVAGRYGAEVRRAGASRPALERALAAFPTQLRLATDGVYFALCAISALTENALTLSCWLSTMPKVHRIEKRVHIDDALRGRALRRFSEHESQASIGSGLTLDRDGAFAWISPDDDRPECAIVTEAWDMEAARELCDFCESQLKKAAEDE